MVSNARKFSSLRPWKPSRNSSVEIAGCAEEDYLLSTCRAWLPTSFEFLKLLLVLLEDIDELRDRIDERVSILA